MRAIFLMLLALLAATPIGALAHGISPTEAAYPISPGTYLWDDVQAPGDPLTISISRPLQRLYVYRGDVLVAMSSISTGRPGHTTPLGEFRIVQKARFHRSNIYSNAPMPFMQRLTWGGIAIHAGHNPGFPASHGCIRVPFAFAQALFSLTSVGQSVAIIDAMPSPPAFLRLEWASLNGGDGGDYAAPTGPPVLDYAPAAFTFRS